MDKKTKVCITIDTEADAADNPNSTFLGIQVAIPRLLDLFQKYDVKATFFVQEDNTCQAGSQFPDLWRSCEKQGHEIGYHAHGIIRSSPEQKEATISRGLSTLRDLGFDPVSYRGGRFHMTGHLLKILEKNNIKYDSSVVPGLREVFQDGTERCNHVGAPREPYYPSYQDHTKAGESGILELPINRYDKHPVELWGGILTCRAKDVILFDFFHEFKRDEIIVALTHSWEGLSFKIRETVRKEKYGKIKKIALGSLRRFFSSEFLTNGTYFRHVERFLKYISTKQDVCFTTIRDAANSWIDGLTE
jgi:hypothetical protein